MLLGVVIGEVWATKKSPALGDLRLLLVEPRCAYGGSFGRDHVVAVDRLGAGPGEEVVVCFGWPTRDQHGGNHLPVDAAVMAIVDRTELTHTDPELPFHFARDVASGASGGAP